MGERGNIVVGGVWMYTHWTGDGLKQILQDALKRGNTRQGDEPYLARIIFCEMIKDDVLGTSGFGLSTSLGDNNYNILVVDSDKRTITEHKEGTPEEKGLGAVVKTWTFDEFVKEKFEED